MKTTFFELFPRQMKEDYESTAYVSIRMDVHLIAELDRRRKQWGLKSRGAVLEQLLGWMVETEGPTEVEPF